MMRMLVCRLFNLVPREQAAARALELRHKLGKARGALYDVKLEDPDFTEVEIANILKITEDLQLRHEWEIYE